MDMETRTDSLGRHMLARRLIEQHGRGQPNWLHWALHNEYLNLSYEHRRAVSFHDYVIQQLGDR